jgi:hypothetical protein
MKGQRKKKTEIRKASIIRISLFLFLHGRLTQNSDEFLMLRLGKNFGSPNLHLCSILRSQDGSCYKVKIIAVILGKPTQTDNSWHKQLWSTVNAVRLRWCHPHASFLFLDWHRVFLLSLCSSSAPSPHHGLLVAKGEFKALNKLALMPFLFFCLNCYFPKTCLSKENTSKCFMEKIFFNWGLIYRVIILYRHYLL